LVEQSRINTIHFKQKIGEMDPKREVTKEEANAKWEEAMAPIPDEYFFTIGTDRDIS